MAGSLSYSLDQDVNFTCVKTTSSAPEICTNFTHQGKNFIKKQTEALGLVFIRLLFPPLCR